MDSTSGINVKKEIWMPISWAKEYKVSNMGRLKYKDKIRKPTIRVRNYYGCSINGKNYLLSRVILAAFFGFDKNKPEAMHLNGNPQDNRLINLKWGTHKENMFMDRGNNHAHKNEKNPNCKLNKAQVEEIRRCYKKGSWWGRKRLSLKFKISEQQIYIIATKKKGGWT